VTITATSNTIYGRTASPVVEPDTYDLEFLDPCTDIQFVTLSSKPQMTLDPDNYSSADVVFTYNPFTVEPSFCEMTVECVDVVGPSSVLECQEITSGKLTWNFTPDNYHIDKLTPGDYVYTFDVSTGPTPELTKQFTVTVTLQDPCITPIVTEPTTAPQSHTITDYEESYPLSDQFSVTPTWCTNKLEYSAPGLESWLQWNEGTQTYLFP
jgi:hypothetical protein